MTWLDRARQVIPGCSQTISKSSKQYVFGVSPIFLERGQGCRVWDVDGNEYIDYVQGLLPNILGYAEPRVVAAAHQQLLKGHSFSLPTPLEVLLAEKLCQIIPCAQMVRFGKNGSDATTGAVRLARAYTGREMVAVCGYHGWHDWYIGSTSRHLGVPASTRDLVRTFNYNDLASLEEVLGASPGQFAAVIMEPLNFVEPQAGFLEGVKQVAHDHGAVLIFDEICTGWHLGLGGAQKALGVIPDLACFGKAMGNGFPISALVGRAEIMKLMEDVFFSFTFGGEAASIAASLKVIEIMETEDVAGHLNRLGSRLKQGFNQLARKHGLAERIQLRGRPSWHCFKYDDDPNGPQLVRSLFQQEANRRGVLVLNSHNMTYAHQDQDIDQTLEVYDQTLAAVAQALASAEPETFVLGQIIQPVFQSRQV
ncbi:MAG: aminotransferase class III-fold pyridoxal phosphate-dependent enzyme [Deltaproteobacteria bacterium]|nr:aminotransferase class III-fold pyridoxal phosphate-dependent enzyme [Deltaproteobacteria bacterium]